MAAAHLCACQPCRRALSAYRAETRALRRGREGRWVDPETTRLKLLELKAAGATSHQIRALTGMPRSAQAVLAHGYPDGREQTRIRAETAARFAEVTDGDIDRMFRPACGTKVSGDTARLQLKSLMSRGWSVKTLSRLSGVPSQTIYRILRGHGTTERYRAGIRGVYFALNINPKPGRAFAQRLQLKSRRATSIGEGFGVQPPGEQPDAA